MHDLVDLQILLPVHNEAGNIRATIQEIYEGLSLIVKIQFIICEDGSQDGTKEILEELSETYPIKLITSAERKGYSKAVKDGMKALEAPYLLCLDSDGQCDPADFWKFWNVRDQADVIVGWRRKRADAGPRKFLSRAFYYLYKLFFNLPIHDPSCPFVLVKKPLIEALVDDMGSMQQGFWWEFSARAYLRKLSFYEIPINHRNRISGKTQVYHLEKIPEIGIKHTIALFQIRFSK